MQLFDNKYLWPAVSISAIWSLFRGWTRYEIFVKDWSDALERHRQRMRKHEEEDIHNQD